jgi:hypothetical protein
LWNAAFCLLCKKQKQKQNKAKQNKANSNKTKQNKTINQALLHATP